jgi:hypothetical protein
MGVLTKKQQKFLDFYEDKRNWRPPTMKQMREFMKVKSDQSIVEYLAVLKKKGRL